MDVKEKSKVNFITLLSFTKGKRHYVIMSIVLSSLAAIVSFVPYYSIYMIIEVLLRSYWNGIDIDGLLLISYGWYAFGGVALNVVLYFMALVCSHLAAFGTLYKLKLDFATHLSCVPLGYHVLVGSGKLRKIMDDNIEKIEGFIAHQLPDIVAALVAPIVALVLLFYIDWRYGVFSVLGIVLSFSLQMVMFGNDGLIGMMEVYQKHLEDMNNGAVEYVRGISVIKAFNQTIYSFKSLKDTIASATQATMDYTLKWKTPMSLFITLINNLYLFIIPLGIILIVNSDDYINTLIVFIFYLLLVPAIGSIFIKTMYTSMNSIRIFGGVERMIEVLDVEPLKEPIVEKIPSSFDIEFKDVHFSYNEDSEALKGISFIVKEGTICALVGESGGGKSTVAHLIPRFFDVSKGSISIGGVDIRSINSNCLMEMVSFVFQDVFLFNQSISDNIKIGNKGASDQDVIDASKAALCHEFIIKLPNGYDTIIGQDGNYLSGGEMQRIAIARAIIKDAPIVVLDEATAFADPENEYMIQLGLSKLLEGKTVIMIAHRLYTIKNADNIVVIRDGVVIEQGRHQDLLDNRVDYYNMWMTYKDAKGWTMGKKRGLDNA